MITDSENKFFQAALRLQDRGFRVFPLARNTKNHPLVPEYSLVASSDPRKVKLWWRDSLFDTQFEHNVAISTTSLSGGKYLLGVDIDNKKGRHGDEDCLMLELNHKYLPDTYEQFTPTGGRHLVYTSPFPIGNSKKKVAPGIDIRGLGGYLVGAGSLIDGKPYTSNDEATTEAPDWLLEELHDANVGARKEWVGETVLVDEKFAEERATTYLQDQPVATEGARNLTAYTVACKLKDFGVSTLSAYELMSEHWKCTPPMPDEELQKSVENAYRYSRDRQGNASAEVSFKDVPEPEPEPEAVPEPPSQEKLISTVDKFNKDYAFIIVGKHHQILHETTDEDGRPYVQLLEEKAFHRKHAGLTISYGNNKTMGQTTHWLNSPDRRSYRGFIFRPEGTPEGFYNLWKGFAVEPAPSLDWGTPFMQEAFHRYREHILENVCGNIKAHAHWIEGFFAHLIQRPWEKPHTALVLQGEKGVGKNAVVDRIQGLLGQYYFSTANPRFLTGNFNSHLECNLVFTLEEAFWSGDKGTDAILKDLVTGSHHAIERKGVETRRQRNMTRVCILGNSKWVVPASEDERRYAIFHVGNRRRQDRPYFKSIADGMEAGGYRLLMRYLLDFDLSTVDVNGAPVTQGLFDQKMESLEVVPEWWYQCIQTGEISGTLLDTWPAEISRNAIREAFYQWARKRGVRNRLPDERRFGKELSRCVKMLSGKLKEGSERINSYVVPSLGVCREQFANFIGHVMEWVD